MLVVGDDSAERSHLTFALTARGHPVFVCPGPPGCALDREDRCVLIDLVRATVFLPTAQGTTAELRACAAESHFAVFARKPAFPIETTAVVAGTLDATGIAATVDRILRATRAPA